MHYGGKYSVALNENSLYISSSTFCLEQTKKWSGYLPERICE